MRGDPTKQGQKLDARYDENVAHLPDSEWFNTQMVDLGSIGTTSIQMAGRRRKLKNYIPNGRDSVQSPSGAGSTVSKVPWSRWS